jgi:hypothetical protein
VTAALTYYSISFWAYYASFDAGARSGTHSFSLSLCVLLSLSVSLSFFSRSGPTTPPSTLAPGQPLSHAHPVEH